MNNSYLTCCSYHAFTLMSTSCHLYSGVWSVAHHAVNCFATGGLYTAKWGQNGGPKNFCERAFKTVVPPMPTGRHACHFVILIMQNEVHLRTVTDSGFCIMAPDSTTKTSVLGFSQKWNHLFTTITFAFLGRFL